MSIPTVVQKDAVVHIHYVLKDDQGQVLDASGARPLGYLHGHGNIVAGLEKALEGKAVGDQIEVTVTPEEGYGNYDEKAYQSVHRRELPKNVRVEPGSAFAAQGTDGKSIPLFITKVQGARVTVTTNHPLAGKTLHFTAQVAALRSASVEEIEHGHVHEHGTH